VYIIYEYFYFIILSAMLLTKTLRVTPSNAQIHLRKERWSEIRSRTNDIDIWSVFLTKLAQFIFMFSYIFMRFYVYIICFYYVY